MANVAILSSTKLAVSVDYLTHAEYDKFLSNLKVGTPADMDVYLWVSYKANRHAMYYSGKSSRSQSVGPNHLRRKLQSYKVISKFTKVQSAKLITESF